MRSAIIVYLESASRSKLSFDHLEEVENDAGWNQPGGARVQTLNERCIGIVVSVLLAMAVGCAGDAGSSDSRDAPCVVDCFDAGSSMDAMGNSEDAAGSVQDVAALEGDASSTPAQDAGQGIDASRVDGGVAVTPNDVLLRTRLGTIVIRVDPESAPITAQNFLQYVDDGFFDGRDGQGQTIFHRVISGFMIQGGGLLANGQRKATRPPIAIESMNGLRNLRGSVAMARTMDPNSATSQFFINHIDNDFLNYAPGNDGYAVFGEVIEGMETVDAIAAEQTGAQDVPLTPIMIEEAVRWADAQ